MDTGKDKRRVILVTDGDRVAKKTLEKAARNIGGRCISASGGNPTPIEGPRIVELIKQAQYDPVIVMFDDKGSCHKGRGEKALEYVASHPDLEIMGILAVASNTDSIEGAGVDCAVTAHQNVVEGQIDKEGEVISHCKVVMGDTVDVINELPKEQVPFVVGIGDIGKMNGHDDPTDGAQVTTRALQIIIDRWESGRQT